MREQLEKFCGGWEMNVADRLEKMCINWKYNVVEGFINDERGDSNMVAVMVLIVIIVAVAGVFRTKLMEAVEKVMDIFIGSLG